MPYGKQFAKDLQPTRGEAMNDRDKVVHINTIVPGDVIVCHDGRDRTVTAKDIKYDSFMGKSIFGDTYHIGTVKIRRVRERA